ncbi:hypothetical protein COCSUDRAFT_34613, partial [Coccomyxa subellipsoidea C-169]
MAAFRSGAVLLCLLASACLAVGLEEGQFEGRKLLVTGNKRSALNKQNTCMAEDICVHKSCGKAYDHTATNFPFTIDYQKTTSSEATTFDFQVCAKSCSQEATHCDTLAAWSLRLDTGLVSDSSFFQSVQPEGELLSECAETGLGYRWAGSALGDLEQHHPSTGDKCEHFQVSVKRDPHMAGHYWLTDICQQAIDIVSSKSGSSAVTQSNIVLKADRYSDVGSCLVHYKLQSGAYGFTMLEDKEYAEKDKRNNEASDDSSNS